jgi:hypothetical protein
VTRRSSESSTPTTTRSSERVWSASDEYRALARVGRFPRHAPEENSGRRDTCVRVTGITMSRHHSAGRPVSAPRCAPWKGAFARDWWKGSRESFQHGAGGGGNTCFGFRRTRSRANRPAGQRVTCTMCVRDDGETGDEFRGGVLRASEPAVASSVMVKVLLRRVRARFAHQHRAGRVPQTSRNAA